MQRKIFDDLNEIVQEDVVNILLTEISWERFSGKTILISGANGFLPAYMVYSLLALNDQKQYNLKVLALVRNEERAFKRFGKFLNRSDLKLIVQDVCLPINLNEKVDFIIHAASQASPKFYGVDPVGTLNSNVTGTINLLTLAEKKKVEKFLYFSSSEVYGILSQDKIPTAESDYGYIDPTNVRSCYAEGKRMGETICVSWMHQFKVPVSIVRPFHTYGPGMDLNDGRVYADFISDIVNNRNIIMNSDGSAKRAFCYISDAVAAFFLVLLKGENGHAYNVGNDKGESSIIDLAEQLTLLFPEKKLKVLKKEVVEGGYIKSLVNRIVPDLRKIQELGWRPSTDIAAGFFRTIKSYL